MVNLIIFNGSFPTDLNSLSTRNFSELMDSDGLELSKNYNVSMINSIGPLRAVTMPLVKPRDKHRKRPNAVQNHTSVTRHEALLDLLYS
ncbi:unnamed protein product [Leptosia nina]|uniref:Uncharacterized protein n=1 Tax=Leptosia nina TaxID=320188 RepID=A0AAV1J0P2_9NEOP